MVRLPMPVALLVVAACKKEPVTDPPAPLVDVAAEEASALKRAKEETARKRAELGLDGAKPTASFEPPTAGAKACMRLAKDTRACVALKPSERENSPACRQKDPNDMKACARHMAERGLDRNPF